SCMAVSETGGGPAGFSLALSQTMSLGRSEPVTAARCAYAISGIRRVAAMAAPANALRVNIDASSAEVHHTLEARAGSRGRLKPAPQSLAAHGVQEFAVAASLPELVEQQFHGLHRGERIEHLAQDPHAVELVLGQQQFLFARAALVDVD